MPSKIKQLEKKMGKPVPELLIELYNKHQNINAVAEALGVHQSTVSYWVAKSGLEFKTVLAYREVRHASQS